MESKYSDSPPELKPGEPWFFLRGQDKLAPPAVSFYAALLRAAASVFALVGRKAKADHLRSMAKECENIAAEMIAWQAAHPEFAKLPD